MQKIKKKTGSKRTRRPRRFFLPDRARPLRRKFKKVAFLRFRKRGKRYTIFLVSNNPRVNIQNEICYFANLIRLKTPPVHVVTVEIKKPSGWRKLRSGFYVGMNMDDFVRNEKIIRGYQRRNMPVPKKYLRKVDAKRQMKHILDCFRKGKFVPVAHKKKLRR